MWLYFRGGGDYDDTETLSLSLQYSGHVIYDAKYHSLNQHSKIVVKIGRFISTTPITFIFPSMVFCYE